MADMALSGIKVLDITTRPSGNYCTKLLADYGADVLLVERPGVGHPVRSLGPFKDDDPHPEKSGFFLYLNINKKSITLDIEKPSGASIFKDLVRDADIVVETFPPGTLEGMGLGYPELEKVNPRVVLTSVTPFGQTGPYKDYKGNDLIIQALCSVMAFTGEANREPLKVSGYYAELFGGGGAAVATMGAFWLADETGMGQQVDVSELESLTNIGSIYILSHAYTGMLRPKYVPKFPNILPCKDGWIGINLLTQWHWEYFCQLMGREDLLKEPKYALPSQRGLVHQELSDIFRPLLMERTAEELFHKAAGEMALPLGIPLRADQIMEWPQHKARGFIVDVEHPVIGKTKILGAPFRLSESPWQLRSPAPLLGQHNEEVYAKLGYGKEDLVLLRERGII